MLNRRIEGIAWTTSLDIAQKFGKNHSKVLRDIKKLECSLEFNEANFGLVSYVDAKGDGKVHKRGRGTSKAPVMVMVERDGKAVSMPIDSVDGATLKPAIMENVNKESTIMTDELTSYTGIGKDFDGGHKTVNHSLGQFVNGNASTNTAESYFALLKRGVYGTFHHISRKHLGRYCNEFSFRWDNRGITDGERTENVVKGIVGKRLMYEELVKKHV